MMSLKTVVLFAWQLPQVLIAFLICVFFHKRSSYTVDYLTVNRVSLGEGQGVGFSLGPYIFAQDLTSDDMLKHEVGHSKQSLFLGPLYLLVVAIPSMVTFLVFKLVIPNEWYHKQYPERWADRLGGAYEFNKNPK